MITRCEKVDQLRRAAAVLVGKNDGVASRWLAKTMMKYHCEN